ncbi:MAG: transporter substrate-binding domain-containing protein [Pseudomonadales bacterium]|nr:transporter substrate-binding domain-containing protein [Pseudomonadales bacterium]
MLLTNISKITHLLIDVVTGLQFLPFKRLKLAYFLRLLFSTLSLLFYSATSAGFELLTAAQPSTPKYISMLQNGNPVIAGLCIDIMRAIEKTEPRVKFRGDQQYLPFSRIHSMLDKGSLDVFFGLAKNSQRLKKFTYIDMPLYSVHHVVAVRADDDVDVTTFAQIKALGQQGMLLTVNNTATHRYLNMQGGLIVDASSQNVPENLRKLLAKRGRFVYNHHLGLIDSINRENYSKKIKILPTNFRSYQHYVAFSKSVSADKIAIIRRALQKLQQTGELAEILKKYTVIH